MKTSHILSAALLVLGFTFAACGQSNVSLKLVDQDVSKVLEVYRAMTGVDLIVASDIPKALGKITVQSKGPTSNEDAARLLKRALSEQAGVILTRLNDGRVSVSYSGVPGDDRKALPPGMKWGTLVLTRDDVLADSVRVFGPDKGANLAFVFVEKTSEEIEKLKKEVLGKRVPIKEGDKVLAVGGAGGGYTDKDKKQGLVLIFESKAEAKIAARVLRGERVEQKITEQNAPPNSR